MGNESVNKFAWLTDTGLKYKDVMQNIFATILNLKSFGAKFFSVFETH